MEYSISISRLSERRAKPRINCDYEAIVHGVDEHGNKFAEEGRVYNLSSSGIILVNTRSIQIDTEVNVMMALPTGSLQWGTSKLGMKGIVLRNEIQSDGAVGIAIKLQSHDSRFR